MAIENLREIGNVLYEQRADGMLYPVRRIRPDMEAQGVKPQTPGILDVGGLREKLTLLNKTFNPVEAIGQSMRAGERMMSPDVPGWDRVAALGDMLSGVAGVTAPAAALARTGAPAATALMEGLLGWSPTREAVGDTARAVGRDVVDRLNQRGPMPTTYSNPIPGLLGGADEAAPQVKIKGWHGTPHEFPPAIRVLDRETGKTYVQAADDPVARGFLSQQPDRYAIVDENPLGMFDFSKMGTGEGAQAYGWGGYLSEAPDVSRSYRDMAGSDMTVGGKPISEIYEKISSRADRLPAKAAEAEYSKMALLDDLMNDGDIFGVMERAKNDAYDAATLSWFEKEISPKFKRQGSLYEVNVNANPDDFIDYDAPWNAQPEAVKRHFSHLARGGRAPTGEDLAQRIEGPLWAKEAAQAGIPGIKYLDSGSRGAGEGSRNYVVFDENLINIVRKYGIAGAAIMLGMSEADVAQAMQQQQPQGLLSTGAQ